MGFDSIWHWLALLVVVLLIFGTAKLKNVGSDLGSAVRGFKKAMHDDDDEEKKRKTQEQLKADPPPAGTSQSTQSQHDSSEPK